MDLGFATQWPDSMGKWAGQDTFFQEKIWTAFNLGIGGNRIDYVARRGWLDELEKRKDFNQDRLGRIGHKVHTLRSGKRWEKGDEIHFVINDLSIDRFQFAPVLRVARVQDIEIKTFGNVAPQKMSAQIRIDGNLITEEDEIEALAKHDGFESPEQFFTWFNRDFEGQIVHWTDITY